MRHPFYQQIVAALEAKNYHWQDFERCMCDLLRDHPFESLVPIPGGSDAGMDGAIADGHGAPYPLVCTTDKHVLRNLTGSLESYRKRGGQREKVLLATSVALTPQRRRNLDARAESMGFTLVQIFEQQAIADRLYSSERWCWELLSLTWRPQALSPVPRPGRPQLEIQLIGRDADVQWLKTTSGDRLITGQPGSGKTFLLRHLAREGWGFFLDSEDPGDIRSAVIEMRPGVVIVDDAHQDPDRLIDLRKLRQQLRQDFAIVATCWSGEKDAVAEALGCLPVSHIRDLELLTADQIVEVIRQTGVRANDRFLRHLREQAANKPGLAVTLATLCLRGSWSEVLSGDALARSLMTGFSKLVDGAAPELLAVLGVGGDQGTSLEVASEFLGMAFHRARRIAIQLGMGGVLSEVGERALAVQPEALRSALIRKAFFEGPRPARLGYRPLIDLASSRESAIAAIITAVSYGAEVPAGELRSLVEECPVLADWQIYSGIRQNVWRLYAALGEDHARWALENYPGDLRHVATLDALNLAPRATIPRLLARAAEERTEGTSDSDWPLDLLRKWTQDLSAEEDKPGINVARRKFALRLAREQLDGGRSRGVTIRVLRIALFPGLESSSRDPGMGRTVTLRKRLLPNEQLTELLALWRLGRELIEELDSETWAFLKEVAWDWTHPDSVAPGTDLEPAARDTLKDLARGVLADLTPLAVGSPGLTTGLIRLAKRVGVELELDADPLFELLYPQQCYDEGERRKQDRTAATALRALARRWGAAREPSDVARDLSRYDKEAAKIGHQGPRRAPDLCAFLVERAENPSRWAGAFLAQSLRADLLRPFLEAIAKDQPTGWEELLLRCLNLDFQAWGAVRLVLQLPDPPARLLEAALSKSGDYPQLVDFLCQRGVVPVSTVLRLLDHRDPLAGVAAAVGEWNAEPDGEVRIVIRNAWRQAVLRSARIDTDSIIGPGFAYYLRVILSADPELSLEWLEEYLDTDPAPPFTSSRLVLTAVDALEAEGRLVILERLEAGSLADWLLPRLVGRDLAVFGRLLELCHLQRHHLRPLSGRPDPEWCALARLALDKGIEPCRIARASFLTGSSLSEDGSGPDHGLEYWTRWDRAFAELEKDRDEDLSEVARYGRERTQSEIRRSATRKRKRELDGL